MTCHFGEGIVVCDGQSGWRVFPSVLCPWGKESRRCIGTAIFSGWCGYDFICGTCGTYWSSEDDERIRKISEDERDANVAKVATKADPQCWECHDTGWAGESPVDMGHPCECIAGKAVAATEAGQ